MQSSEGGYYSTLDADSEGKEGKYYVWQPEEIRALLGDDEYRVFAPHFGLDQAPNFEGEDWNLHVYQELDAVAHENDMTLETASLILNSARSKLFKAREGRIRPGRDEKILTSWNALMIKAMAVAGQVLGERRYVASAQRALDFLVHTLWRDGRLLATYKDGRAHLAAYLDDYAFTIDALLTMLSVRWRKSDFDLACALANCLLERFQDPDGRGFFFTADDHEKLLHRSKSFMDDALPAGNAVAALALGRLGHLLGESLYLDAAQATVNAAWQAVEQLPHAHNGMLDALEEQLDPPQTIVIRASPSSIGSWQERCARNYSPGRLCIAIPDDVEELPGLLGYRLARGDATAYLCEGHHCDAPIDDFHELDAALRRSEVCPR